MSKFPVYYFHKGEKVASRAKKELPKEGDKVRFRGTLYKIKNFFMGKGFVHVELEEE